ncbi:hypothetical protein LX64_00622 [Chitinophaga skermanii]|uniref:SdpI/YhfL family protein n=1 Tax=Chitinophaga skermanii TaxID=331697 RepID=A0A327R476_9BACT|nr:SdpI family protein [Chitinophaga skermanii]RAJ11015.1 hypothetical protein LX64_00622 [Chitinophaga skermanii]
MKTVDNSKGTSPGSFYSLKTITMIRPNYFREILFIALLFLPMVYLGIVWPSLPNIFPSNYNLFTGTPERVGPKSDILLLLIFLFVTNGVLYALFRYIPKTEDEPPQEAKSHMAQYYRIRFRIHFFLSLFSCTLIWMASHGKVMFLEKWTFLFVGLMVATIGVFLKNLHPNNYVGVRTPWTLQSDINWTLTHHMASKLWLFTGIAIAVGGMFIPMVAGICLFIVTAGILAYLPFVYSYRLFYKEQG